MVLKMQEMQTAVHEKMRDGNGSVHMRHLIPGEMFYGHGRVYSLVTLEPGASIGWHEHHQESESYYILSGTAKLSDNGKEVILHPGDCGICPDGEGHSVENCGDTTLQLIALIVYGSGINR